jgi:hypothetical protein
VATVTAGIAAGVGVLIAAGGPSRGASVLALALFVLGFVALRWTVTPARRPWSAVRAVLGVAAVIELFALASLPWPPGPAERTAWTTAFLLVVFTVAAGVFATSRTSRIGALLSGALALYAAQSVVRFLVAPHWAPRPYAAPVEPFVLAFFLVMAAALLAAFALVVPEFLASTRARRVA